MTRVTKTRLVESVCAHCSVMFPARELSAKGFCRLCLEEEGAPVDFGVEETGVRICRAAGLRAVSRPCQDGDPKYAKMLRDNGVEDAKTKCETCRAIHDARCERPMAPNRKPHPNGFMHEDEAQLQRYFSKSQSDGIGARKGTMMAAVEERFGSPVEFRSSERPARTEPRCPVCVAVARAQAIEDVFRAAKATSEALQANHRSIQSRGALAETEPVAVSEADLLPDVDVMHFESEAPTQLTNEARLLEIQRLAEEQLADATDEPLPKHLTGSHRHSKADVDLFRPTHFHDIEIDGLLLQVAVYPPSIEPDTYESHYIQAKGSADAARFGSWDDDAVSHVSGRSTDAFVARVLARMQTNPRDVLEAFYSSTEELSVRQGSDNHLGNYHEVAEYTEAAQKAVKELETFSALAAIGILQRKAIGTSQSREGAVKRLQTMRQQAEALVGEAKNAYGRAAAGLPW